VTIDEFAEQEMILGQKIHRQGDTWWRQKHPQFCVPLIPFRSVSDGLKPAISSSLIGYSYFTDGSEYDREESVMAREKGGFDISELSSNRRSKVRRGLKRNEICITDEIKPHLEQMKALVVSARERTGAGKPIEYYDTNYQEWQETMLKLAKMKDRKFWLAYQGEQLAAYFHTTQIQDMLIINAAKSHSDFLSNYPNDALAHEVMDYASNHQNCKYLVYGHWVESDTSLNKFKESFGFTRKVLRERIVTRLPIKKLLLKKIS
jgi:hypothetical protein